MTTINNKGTLNNIWERLLEQACSKEPIMAEIEIENPVTLNYDNGLRVSHYKSGAADYLQYSPDGQVVANWHIDHTGKRYDLYPKPKNEPA